MALFKIMTLDLDTIDVFTSLEDAEEELRFYDDEHCIQEIGEEEWKEFMSEQYDYEGLPENESRA